MFGCQPAHMMSQPAASEGDCIAEGMNTARQGWDVRAACAHRRGLAGGFETELQPCPDDGLAIPCALLPMCTRQKRSKAQEHSSRKAMVARCRSVIYARAKPSAPLIDAASPTMWMCPCSGSPLLSAPAPMLARPRCGDPDRASRLAIEQSVPSVPQVEVPQLVGRHPPIMAATVAAAGAPIEGCHPRVGLRCQAS